MKIRTRLIVKHRKDCTSVAEVRAKRWVRPGWYTADPSPVMRDYTGMCRGRNHAWLLYRCVDDDCSARLLINEESVFEAAITSDGLEYHLQTATQREPTKLSHKNTLGAAQRNFNRAATQRETGGGK